MNPAQIASVKEMLKDGPVRVSDVKAKLKLKRDTRIGELAEELKAAGFTLQKWERTWIVTGVSAEIEIESKPEPEPEPDNAAGTVEPEAEPASAVKPETDTIKLANEILAPLGDLDERYSDVEQMELGILVTTMLYKTHWRLSSLAKKSGLVPSVVEDWMQELRQYGIVAVSLNAISKDLKYIFTRNIEKGFCYCSLGLHTKLPMHDGQSMLARCWTQVKNRISSFEKSAGFATVQDVRFALDWPKEDFDAVLEDFKRRSILQVMGNKLEILHEDFADYEPVGHTREGIMRDLYKRIPAYLTEHGPTDYKTLESAMDVHFGVFNDAQYKLVMDKTIKFHDGLFSMPLITKDEAAKREKDIKLRKFRNAVRSCRVHPDDASEFVSVAAVLNKMGCKNRSFDEFISQLTFDDVIRVKFEPTSDENHPSRYRNYKCRLSA